MVSLQAFPAIPSPRDATARWKSSLLAGWPRYGKFHFSGATWGHYKVPLGIGQGREQGVLGEMHKLGAEMSGKCAEAGLYLTACRGFLPYAGVSGTN